MSKHIREKIQKKYGQSIRYPKDCHALAEDISKVCKAKISASTLKRLYGFVQGATNEPRLYTLDLISEYLGYRGWEHLLTDLTPETKVESHKIERLNAAQVKKGQVVAILYEPGKKLELRKTDEGFLVLSSNDRKLIPDDLVTFRTLELHIPATFDSLVRKGTSQGKIQVATVSGVTGIRKE
ncbi:MAG: hypothetical protein JST83_05325 [Bacteroidetes bacterium]|nr:hypothetical protein [Bacteroidota bacterium]